MSDSATDLAYLPATEALAKFRSRELSPVELMAALIARAGDMEPTVNAFTWQYFDEALAAATLAEERYMGKGAEPRPLEGIAVAIKEEMGIAGQPQTFASAIYKDLIADHTAPMVQRLLDAGAIVHARTTQPEFACAAFTHSPLFGVTRNPWNPAFDVGGSSGGAAASLAAGTTTLATGSDIGGSIRIPASCCGVVGFKPPYGRAPQEPPFNLDHYCHEGPMTRTVADCALFENLIAGPHPIDIASLRDPIQIPVSLGEVRDWKIALSLDLDGWDIDPDVRANTLKAAETLREAGSEVEEVSLGWNRREISEAASHHFAAIFGAWVGGIPAEQQGLMTPYARGFAELVANPPPGSVLRGLELEGEIYAKLGALLERYQILVCPTLAIPALPAGFDQVGKMPGATEWGLHESYGWDHMMTIPFNICSRCPVMSVPSGFAASGVPTGLQIVGRTYSDIDVFQVAAALEQRAPWLDTPGRRPLLGAV